MATKKPTEVGFLCVARLALLWRSIFGDELLADRGVDGDQLFAAAAWAPAIPRGEPPDGIDEPGNNQAEPKDDLDKGVAPRHHAALADVPAGFAYELFVTSAAAADRFEKNKDD